MPIIDPIAIKFVNEQARPLAELSRSFKARVADMSVEWFNGVNVIMKNDASPVEDGREKEGVTRLTGANVTNAVAGILNAAAALDDAVIGLLCVRPLQAN